MQKIFRFIIISLLSFSYLTSQAQKVTTIPETFLATDSIKILVDISKCDRKQLVGHPGPLYLWTWSPKEGTKPNGTWPASNLDLAMTHEGGDIWSFSMVPTNFYGVDAATVYEKDIKFLVKAYDGTGGAAGEDKTEDLLLTVDPPKTGPRKLSPFPDFAKGDTIYITGNDALTIIFDKSQDTLATSTLKNGTEFFVFPKAKMNDGTYVTYVPIAQASTLPELQMKPLAGSDTKYRWTFVPNLLFKDKIPAGKSINAIKFQVARKTTPVTANDATEAKEFWLILE
jgi:hypothetical protein